MAIFNLMDLLCLHSKYKMCQQPVARDGLWPRENGDVGRKEIMAKRISTLAVCWSIGLVVTSFCSCRNGRPTQTIAMFRATATPLLNMNYMIHIYARDSQEPMQSIAIRNGIDLRLPGAIQFVDINSDDMPDMKILGGRVGNSNWYKIWIYNLSSGRFLWSHTTDSDEDTPNKSLNRTGSPLRADPAGELSR
jgi:hypothetical protein